MFDHDIASRDKVARIASPRESSAPALALARSLKDDSDRDVSSLSGQPHHSAEEARDRIAAQNHLCCTLPALIVMRVVDSAQGGRQVVHRGAQPTAKQ